MRLLDQIMAAPDLAAVGNPGSAYDLFAAPTEKREALEQCELRYILDSNASRECMDLARSDTGLLLPDNPLVRLPAQAFWIEWFGERHGPGDAQHRMGVLVDCAPDNRQGEISAFWVNQLGFVEMSPAQIVFDLDEELHPPGQSQNVFALAHGTIAHLNPLFRHVLFCVDEDRARHLRAYHGTGYRTALRHIAEATWYCLPIVLAFSALINSREFLDIQRADLRRLNQARAKRGRRALLEHLEVRMSINMRVTGSDHTGGGGVRAASRLHHVRGHMVQRSGKIFWRSPHLRGDPYRVIRQKTVQVYGRSEDSR